MASSLNNKSNHNSPLAQAPTNNKHTPHMQLSKMRSSYFAGPSQTGQVHVGFFSFIIKNREASKHCRWSQVVGRQGIDILIFPSRQLTVTFKLVVAMPSSSSVSFFLMSSLVNSGCLLPFRVSLSSSCSLESFSTSHMPTTQPLP